MYLSLSDSIRLCPYNIVPAHFCFNYKILVVFVVVSVAFAAVLVIVIADTFSTVIALLLLLPF